MSGSPLSFVSHDILFPSERRHLYLLLRTSLYEIHQSHHLRPQFPISTHQPIPDQSSIPPIHLPLLIFVRSHHANALTPPPKLIPTYGNSTHVFSSLLRHIRSTVHKYHNFAHVDCITSTAASLFSRDRRSGYHRHSSPAYHNRYTPILYSKNIIISEYAYLIWKCHPT
jgi:hypothetical protein